MTDKNDSEKKMNESGLPKKAVNVDADGLPISLEENSMESKTFSNHLQGESSINKTIQDEFTEDEEEDIYQPIRVHRFATIMNMLNSLLGAGILGVPCSMMNIGIIPSILLLLFIAFLSHVCTVLTIKLQIRTNADGLDDLAFRILGRIGSTSLSIMSVRE